MSSLYLTNIDMSTVATSGAEPTLHKLNTTPGAAATRRNKNSVTGPTAPLKVTDSTVEGTDGSAIAWYSEPLQPVTIAGQITCRLWDKEAATANNIAPCIGIYRCSAVGVELATIVAPTINQAGGEMGTTTTGTSDIVTITAAQVTDTAIGSGELLKVALFIDDAANQGGTGSMATGGRGVFWVNGPVGVQGQSEIAFTETITLFNAQPRATRAVQVTRQLVRRSYTW